MSETEETQTASLLTCTVGQRPSCGWVDGLVGEFGGGVKLTPQGGEFTNVCFSNGERPPPIPPLLLLSSTKNVNVLALSREQG